MGRLPKFSATKLLAFAISVHLLLESWIAWHYSPTVNEVAQMPSGMRILLDGKFDIYTVNPPLVRTWAAFAAMAQSPAPPPFPKRIGAGDRPEWILGQEFLHRNAEKAIAIFRTARLACLPFSVIGAVVCYGWASRLSSSRAGLIAAILWCFSPNILAYGALITPDLAAASLGCASCFAFWLWLKKHSFSHALVAGILLGIAELTKFTWLILYVAFPGIWCVTRLHAGSAGIPLHERKPSRSREALQLVVVLLSSVLLINLGYRFEGTFRRLGDYEFVSSLLVGQSVPTEENANRFRGTVWSRFPVPLPKHFTSGVDLQKKDFERPWSCYLDGKWQTGGWWHYYIWAFLYKLPLATLVLGAFAALQVNRRKFFRGHGENLCVVVPPILLFTVASSQTNMTIHFRYMLGCLPFLFVLIGWAFDNIKGRWGKSFGLAFVLWSILSGLAAFPYCLSYFNIVAGGSANGHRHLVDSNLDWGQDLLYLGKWYRQHPQARPLHVCTIGGMQPNLLGIEAQPVPGDPRCYVGQMGPSRPPKGAPEPGWYAISINCLMERSREFDYFMSLKPVDRIGYTIYCYHLSEQTAAELKHSFGHDNGRGR